MVRFNLKKWMAAFCIAVVLSTVWSFASFAEECGEIRETVFRLHVLANSDSEEDQALKLNVRDRVLEETGDLFTGAMNKQEAVAAAQAALPQIEQAAEQVLREHGSDASVTVETCNMYFTTRYYDKYTLPAGNYDALRISIGEAKGHNWWCVLYPALCLPGAMQEEAADAVFDENQQNVVENGEQYRFSFALLEWLESLKQ